MLPVLAICLGACFGALARWQLGLWLNPTLTVAGTVLPFGTLAANLLGDFLARRPSSDWGSVRPSYQPGVRLSDLTRSLPPYAIAAIREAIPAFGKKIKGFDMQDAVLTGVETRTSSPLKIPRGDNLQSTNVAGLYPAGEGASYAGGILSAAVDGIKVAEAVARSLLC